MVGGSDVGVGVGSSVGVGVGVGSSVGVGVASAPQLVGQWWAWGQMLGEDAPVSA